MTRPGRRPVLRAMLLALWGAIALRRPLRAEDQPFREDAEAWLALVDRRQYDESWSRASAYFRFAVAPPHWTELARGAREPLGELVARTLRSVTHVTALPGAPDGDYRVLRFDSRFAYKTRAVETLTLAREADGWRVAGYFIK